MKTGPTLLRGHSPTRRTDFSPSSGLAGSASSPRRISWLRDPVQVNGGDRAARAVSVYAARFCSALQRPPSAEKRSTPAGYLTRDCSSVTLIYPVGSMLVHRDLILIVL